MIKIAVRRRCYFSSIDSKKQSEFINKNLHVGTVLAGQNY